MTVPDPSLLRLAAEAAMRDHGFVPEFPPEVVQQAATVDDPSDDALPPGSRDLRALPWTSIDNRESRDLDQVEVAEELPDGSIRLYIGIADVNALVPRGTPADDHAATNTTSVYTGVVVFPMLPERLSTDLSSLNPNEDRLAVVTQFDVDDEGNISGADVYRALVHNHAKLTYTGVGAWLEGHGPVPAPLAASPVLRDQVRLQDAAAARLREARKRAGALDFESVEARPVVANGKVVDLQVTARNRARDLIEDFMVAANRAVAAYLMEHGSPSLRRVVREPKRWDRIVAIADEHGVTLPAAPDSVALSEFLAARREADPENFAELSLAIVKLLGPGVYVLERRLGERREMGHFGLAVADYVHSTAPNRRFPDLVTQRLLYAVERKSGSPYTDEELIAIAERCTERADAARKVERTMRKVAGAAMLADRVGDSFAAVVTGASRKGTYVRLVSPPVEGRVVRGEQGLDVGDTVRVTLVGTDVAKGFVDFAHETADAARKLERSRRKKRAADVLRAQIGKQFEAEVTGVTDAGTWVRLTNGMGEGRVVRGFNPLKVGMTVPVVLLRTDSVHGFIDFEYVTGDQKKNERLGRKRAMAERLLDRVGDSFDASVTGVTPKATWIVAGEERIEGRLVRGRRGLQVGDGIRVVLLRADPVRGFID
ncbi:MAG TPA: RNB domain-containing ribonuclease, partial [Gemmatimonadaceae bacterium]|nr:RNB domain-containing ribonuclease [Gemmatimonadaceae bacterium]